MTALVSKRPQRQCGQAFRCCSRRDESMVDDHYAPGALEKDRLGHGGTEESVRRELRGIVGIGMVRLNRSGEIVRQDEGDVVRVGKPRHQIHDRPRQQVSVKLARVASLKGDLHPAL